MLTTQTFQKCCGAVEVGNFGTDVTYDKVSELKNIVFNNKRKAFLVATLNQTQTKWIKELKKLGFVENSVRSYNTTYGSTIYFFVKALNPVAKPKPIVAPAVKKAPPKRRPTVREIAKASPSRKR